MMRFADTVHRAALVDFTLQMRIMVLLQLSRMPALDDGNAIDRNVMELMNDMRANAVPLEHLAVLSGTRASQRLHLGSALAPECVTPIKSALLTPCGRVRAAGDLEVIPLRQKLALHT